MSDVAIRVDNLGKKYLIGHHVEGNLRGTFVSKINRFLKANSGGQSKEEFWALKDVSFEIKMGDAVGIIGRNGAGKSTLLKILSRITDPTTGRFEINGRVSSLLEVGTGFHSELTGRENIYLNGTILGMRRDEIKKKFAAIVDFSGVEKFIDTPVKHYSSGMKVRLAFSVAAHLEPEILIIDEVLAVGDADFQKKCLGKMDEVSKNDGRTILFVSHNMAAIENLCKSAILFEKGRLSKIGKVDYVISSYYDRIPHDMHTHFVSLKQVQNRQGSGKVRFVSIQVNKMIRLDERVIFELELNNEQLELNKEVFLAITIFDTQNVKLATLDNLFSAQKIYVSKGHFRVTCEVDSLGLLPGQYFLDLWLADGYELFDQIAEAAAISVEPSDVYATGRSQTKGKHGLFKIPNNWKIV